MPRLSQIIPEYLQPHVSTYINDNTIFEDTTATSTGGVRFLSVFASPKGRDGILMPITSLSEYISEFGAPNYAKYGQPGYMPTAILRQTNASVWCMRVVAQNARYANAILVAKIKPGVSGLTPTPMQILFELKSAGEINSESDLIAAMSAFKNEDPTSNPDGILSYPIMGFMSKGRGKYGNKTSFSIHPDISADKDSAGTAEAYKNYTFRIYDTEISQVLVGSYTGCMDMEAVYNNSSVYIEDIMDDPDTGSTRTQIVLDPESINKIFGMYTTLTEGQADRISALKLFPLFETVSRTLPDQSTEVVYEVLLQKPDEWTEVYAPVDVSSVTGLPMAGGTDGDLDAAEASVRDTALENAYLAAFTADAKKYPGYGMDTRIRSKRATPCEFILDANYPEMVKNELISLVLSREDAYGIIDAGIKTTMTEILDWSNEMASVSSIFFGKTCQHYKMRDTYSGKIIPVTTTYFYASKIASHFNLPGNQVPFVGKSYATLTGHIKHSMLPDIDADDLSNKEILYENKVNYFETVGENNYIRAVQGTANPVWSDLSEENNMLVVLEMKRKLENMVQERIYSFAEPDDRRKFTEAANRMFNDYRGNKVRDFSVDFAMNAWEEERSILHCYLSVIFRTMAKRGIIEIDINKRV